MKETFLTPEQLTELKTALEKATPLNEWNADGVEIHEIDVDDRPWNSYWKWELMLNGVGSIPLAVIPDENEAKLFTLLRNHASALISTAEELERMTIRYLEQRLTLKTIAEYPGPSDDDAIRFRKLARRSLNANSNSDTPTTIHP